MQAPPRSPPGLDPPPRPRRRPLTRAGMSALLLVMGAALVMLIWVAAQYFVTGTVQRRVRIADVSRRGRVFAEAALDEAAEFLEVRLNTPDSRDLQAWVSEDTQHVTEDLMTNLLTLEPGEVLEFEYLPALAELPQSGEAGPSRAIQRTTVHVRAYMEQADDATRDEEARRKCREASAAYAKFDVKWSRVPG